MSLLHCRERNGDHRQKYNHHDHLHVLVVFLWSKIEKKGAELSERQGESLLFGGEEILGTR